MRAGDFAETFRFTCGDYSASYGISHLSMYRAFQAWSIPKHFGIPCHLSSELIAGLNEHVVPHADEWRQWGVFPPAIEPPAGADEETRLLGAVGFWVDWGSVLELWVVSQPSAPCLRRRPRKPSRLDGPVASSILRKRRREGRASFPLET